ncbi:MAG: GNAT family N-acetyltransferase, partial [Victivallales bacterium]|nr:GNAT family N-acetyltransferase [Victivallales bacterium]
MDDGLEHPLYGQRYWPRLHRPRGLLHFRESENILVSGITIIDPPSYNIWALGCDNCDFVGIKIRTDLKGPNNDGIDIDCCSNVRITGCDISCSDDAIGIFSDINTLGYNKTCEDIVVSDCRILATSDGIRIGYVGDGAIRRVTITNCIIHDTMIGISMMTAISPDDPRAVYIKYGPEITGVIFSNLVIDAFQTFNFQGSKTPSDTPLPIKGYIDRVFLRNITATAMRGSLLSGVPESPLRTVEISGLHLTLSGEMGTDFLEKVPEPYPTWSDLPWSGIPWPFFARHAKRIILRDSTIEWRNATGDWQPEIVKCDKANASLRNVESLNFPWNEYQLRMYFDGASQKVPQVNLPDGFAIRTLLDTPKDREAYNKLRIAGGFDFWNDETLDNFKMKCLIPDGLVVIEEIGSGRLVASATAEYAELEGMQGTLGWVMTDPEFRGKGLCKAVSCEAVKRLVAAGLTKLYLTTDDFRIPAIAVYLKLKWRPWIFRKNMKERWERICGRLGYDLADAYNLYP